MLNTFPNKNANNIGIINEKLIICILPCAPKINSNIGVKNKLDNKNPALLSTKIKITIPTIKPAILKVASFIIGLLSTCLLCFRYFTISAITEYVSKTTMKNKIKVGTPAALLDLLLSNPPN